MFFFWERAFNCNFEITFGCTFGDVGNACFTCEFDAELEGYFVDVGDVGIIRFFEGIDGAEGVVSEGGFEAIEVCPNFFGVF